MPRIPSSVVLDYTANLVEVSAQPNEGFGGTSGCSYSCWRSRSCARSCSIGRGTGRFPILLRGREMSTVACRFGGDGAEPEGVFPAKEVPAIGRRRYGQRAVCPYSSKSRERDGRAGASFYASQECPPPSHPRSSRGENAERSLTWYCAARAPPRPRRLHLQPSSGSERWRDTVAAEAQSGLEKDSRTASTRPDANAAAAMEFEVRGTIVERTSCGVKVQRAAVGPTKERKGGGRALSCGTREWVGWRGTARRTPRCTPTWR
ncbi:hypothetical protein C8R45DRAFT_401202 [Mycena sanguinolenta]|nr:hypothetical protein C8R45DRAFT_401202 [Mycena sanguinolenta]